FHRLLGQLSKDENSPCKGIVHLWSLDASPSGETTPASLEASRVLGPVSTLHLVQALAANLIESARLWLVTRGAQKVLDEDESIAPAQTTLWGLGKTIAREYPQLGCINIDLSFDRDPDEVQSLCEEFWSPDGEDQIALRRQRRYRARLVRAPESVRSRAVTKFTPDGTYLITGGLGGLGLTVASWMVTNGARHLMLLGRRHPSPSVEALLDSLCATGAQIGVSQADVSQPADVQNVVAKIKDSMPPLRGVIHSALLLDVGIIVQQTAESFKTVWEPKVSGAWNLHEQTLEDDLDFFVMFSSASSMLGSPGQSNYAAATAFLDGLAFYRRGKGLPGLSINWGAWAEVGRAAQLDMNERLATGVFQRMSPQQALEILLKLLQSDVTQAGVMAVDWSRFRDVQSAINFSPLFSYLTANGAGPSPARVTVKGRPKALTLEVLRLTAPEERQRLLEDHLRQQVSATLGSTSSELDINQPLNLLGMDSLMALELKNNIEASFGTILPVATLLKGPSTAQLACEIINRLPEAEVAPLPTIMPVPECWYEPFPLNDIQQAYWIGRGDAFDLGNIATHGYLEVESDELD